MHKLIEYLCDELDELEAKVKKGGELSMTELEYGNELAQFKKNLLKGEAMMEDAEYSNAMNGSYARTGIGRGSNAKRDSMGRYSSDGYSRNDGEYSRDYSYGTITEHLEEMLKDEPNEYKRREIKNFVDKMKKM